MSEHFGAVEADFQSHYGLDLRSVLWGPLRLGVRRVLSLVLGLPPTGALFRAAVTDGKSWTTTDELLATVIEVLDQANGMYYSAHVKPGSQKWTPIEIHRPVTGAPPEEEPIRNPTAGDLWMAFDGQVVYEASES
jgi:hypothetical protein